MTVTETRYRYRVTETWGDVPEQVSRLVGEPTGFLLYAEWRGEESEQELWQDGKGIVGGWALEYFGEVDLDPETHQLIDPVPIGEAPSRASVNADRDRATNLPFGPATDDSSG